MFVRPSVWVITARFYSVWVDHMFEWRFAPDFMEIRFYHKASCGSLCEACVGVGVAMLVELHALFSVQVFVGLGIFH